MKTAIIIRDGSAGKTLTLYFAPAGHSVTSHISEVASW